MHYIRFLRTPKVVVDKSDISLRAVISIETDLAETYLSESVELVATVQECADHGDVYLRRRIQWPSGARSLPIIFDISRNDIEWPACVHVAVKQSPVASVNNGGHGFLPPIVDVWSSPINAVQGQFDSGRRVERRFISASERTISILEDAGDSIARHLWDGSQALCQYIDQLVTLQTPSDLPLLEYVLVSAIYRRFSVLELGCGCGTVGLALAQMITDCDVMLTDLPEVDELVAANVARLNPAINSKVSFVPLDWEQPIPSRVQSRTNDLIVVSECTYNADTLQLLVNTLSALLVRSPKAVIVVSTKTRHSSEAAFFDMMQAAGLVQDGAVRVKLPGQAGTGYADQATDVGLHVFRGQGHRLSLSPRESESEGSEKREKKSRIRSQR